MDALEEQLAQLQLLNSRPLTSRIVSNSDRGGSRHVVESEPLYQLTGLQKKLGPAVPPKPKKLQSTVETYSRHDQSADLDDFSTGNRDGIPRKHNNQHVYSNMKMTLDNSVILDQQLEALEYHKKRLEKRYPSNQDGSGIGLKTNTDPNQSYHVYTNLIEDSDTNSKTTALTPHNLDTVVYSNIRHQSHEPLNDLKAPILAGDHENQIVYSNVGFEELPPPPPMDIPSVESQTQSATLALDPINLDYLHQQQIVSGEEDLPPPPSPVSSSYSELRRATDNFPRMPQYPVYTKTSELSQPISINHQNKSSHSYSPNRIVQDVAEGQAEHAKSRIYQQQQQQQQPQQQHRQQTYVNTPYQNVYNPYDPNSQILSSSPTTSDYYGYGDLTQSSSTYESIYEPINPRPPSQLSSQSNYSLYTSYVNGSQMTAIGSNTPSLIGTKLTSSSSLNSNGGGNGSRKDNLFDGNESQLQKRKEAEVEALTNLLVHSMDGETDIDSYGICVKCDERIVGEASGCTAMEQIYHIGCFTCSQCQINLQGKPFYALEGKPYCEEDYLNTLEKCSVCMKPILERILRATGKPYHPCCFCCVVCGNSLDGIPFTVDATNQNYCIEDFHKKFAPRCCVCYQPIMPEPGQEETVRVVALDRSFHFECYKCEDCGLLLSSEAEGRGCYPLDDHVLCKSCNAARVQALTNRMTTEL